MWPLLVLFARNDQPVRLGAAIVQGPQLDGTYRFHTRGHDLGQMCVLGTFSEYTVVPVASVVKVDRGSPLDKAALVGCCVPTGYGSVVKTASVHPGDAVVIMGIGGIGSNAIQGAKGAGARYIVAIDPVEFKRHKAFEFGATHAVATTADAQGLIQELTRGQMADACVLTTDVAEGSYIGEALSLVGKRGKVIVTAIGHPTDLTASVSLFELALYGKVDPRVVVRIIEPAARHTALSRDVQPGRTQDRRTYHEGILAGRHQLRI